MLNLVNWMLTSLFWGAIALVLLDLGVSFIHGSNNTGGAVVHGFALYEKELPSFSSLPEEEPPGSEPVEFYRHRFECELLRARKQREWAVERHEILEAYRRERSIELPVKRYQCRAFGLVYGPGEGWGLWGLFE